VRAGDRLFSLRPCERGSQQVSKAMVICTGGPASDHVYLAWQMGRSVRARCTPRGKRGLPGPDWRVQPVGHAGLGGWSGSSVSDARTTAPGETAPLPGRTRCRIHSYDYEAGESRTDTSSLRVRTVPDPTRSSVRSRFFTLR
jgi:hypothetical protein